MKVRSHNFIINFPTESVKTAIFSEIAKRFIGNYGKKVIVLTHRDEREQTNIVLKESNAKNTSHKSFKLKWAF